MPTSTRKVFKQKSISKQDALDLAQLILDIYKDKKQQ